MSKAHLKTTELTKVCGTSVNPVIKYYIDNKIQSEEKNTMYKKTTKSQNKSIKPQMRHGDQLVSTSAS